MRTIPATLMLSLAAATSGCVTADQYGPSLIGEFPALTCVRTGGTSTPSLERVAPAPRGTAYALAFTDARQVRFGPADGAATTYRLDDIFGTQWSARAFVERGSIVWLDVDWDADANGRRSARLAERTGTKAYETPTASIAFECTQVDGGATRYSDEVVVIDVDEPQRSATPPIRLDTDPKR